MDRCVGWLGVGSVGVTGVRVGFCCSVRRVCWRVEVGVVTLGYFCGVATTWGFNE